MIKKALYFTLRFYVRVGLFFFFRKIEVRGKSNIPQNKGILFLPNHQNAFLDALIIVGSNMRTTHFVARADIFNNAVSSWFLSLINLMPIFRKRDGWQSLGKNQKIFKKCSSILKKREALMMFPEGNHGSKRMIRPLSKGFTRIAFGTQQVDPTADLYIVPVGLNYTKHKKFRSSVSIYYGQPLLVKDYALNGNAQAALRLRDEVSNQLKTLVTHVEDEANYAQIIKRLDQLNPNYLDPDVTNAQLKNFSPAHPGKENVLGAVFNSLLFPLAFFNNLIAVLLWRISSAKIKDPVFIGSLKFCFGITIVPFIYLIQSALVLWLVDVYWSLGYLLFSLTIAPFLSKG